MMLTYCGPCLDRLMWRAAAAVLAVASILGVVVL